MAETFAQQLERLREVARGSGSGNVDYELGRTSTELDAAVAALLQRYDALLSPGEEPTRDDEAELERLGARMARASRWQLATAAFRLGLRLAASRGRR